MIREFDTVKTLHALPEGGIALGAVGTVLEVFEQPKRAYMVEFSDADGEALHTPFLTDDQIELVESALPG